MFDFANFLIPLSESGFETLSGGHAYTRIYYLGWTADEILAALLPALAVAIFFVIRNARRERFFRNTELPSRFRPRRDE